MECPRQFQLRPQSPTSQTGARLRVLASDANRAYGRAPGLVIADEPASWPRESSDKLIAALRTSIGKIPSARLIAIGTRPTSPEHWFSKMLAGAADVAMSFAPDPELVEVDPFNWQNIRAANPSLYHLPDLRAAIRREIKRAREDSTLLPSFLALRLNQGVSEVAENHLIEPSTWRAAMSDIAPPLAPPIVWGVDLGSGHAMSAIAAYSPQSLALGILAAFPSLPDLAARGRADSVGPLYERMAARGELLTIGGRTVDIGELLSAALQEFGRPSVIVCDRWREAELIDALNAARIPTVPLVRRGQGFRDGGEDVRLFRRAVLEQKVIARRTLLLSAAICEARVVADPAGNEKLAKRSEGGRRARGKDDAAAAAILAVAEGVRRGPRKRRRLRHAVVG